MTITQKDLDKLETLEESMWLESTRFDLDYMDSVLHEDFFEFGRSGKVFNRKTILEIPSGKINATIPLKDFKAELLDENSVIVTYVSEERYDGLARANRCSIWIKKPDGWKLRFHQGTPIV